MILRHLVAGLLTIGLLAAPTQAQPCCGPITPDGERLARFLDASNVTQLWQVGWHVDWRTGEKDRSTPGGPEAQMHCSAFVAAMAEKLGIYVLRPPEHRQELLANAQMRWLREHGAARGWRLQLSDVEAQKAANGGELVLEAFESPDPRKPGHIAITRPSSKSSAALDHAGPQEIQAGTQNALSITTATGFRQHPGAWRSGGGGALRYYAHTVNWP